MRRLCKWYYGEATIRTKLVLSYLVLVLIPILMLGSYSYQILKGNLMRETKDSMSANLSSIVFHLNENITRENDNIRYLSYNTVFREVLGRGSVSDLAGVLNTTIEPTFWYFLTSDENLKRIEICTPSVEHAIGSFLKPMDGKQEVWDSILQGNYKTIWTMQEDELFATRVLLDAETSSKPIGLIQIYVYPDAFLSAMEQSIYRENGVLLVDESGNTVAHRAVADASLDAQIQQACASYEAGFYEQDTYFLQVSDTLKNGWRCYYYIDRVEISESLNQIQIATIRVIGICLVLALCLILGLSKVLNHRILQLKEYAERVSQGNLQLEMQTDWTDEIGIVEKSFAHMSNQINRMMNEMYELGLQKRAEELKALQAMINPHFLYNGLSSIKWKAIRAEQDEIAEAAGLLAKFYRTALNSGKQITTVQNELENIRAYLKIQSYMHDFSFDVEYEIDEEGLAWWMPNFILQPIVENAICHGVEYCENERGWIRVEFTQEGEYLMFRIYNNGSTLDVAEFEKPEKSESGYGLSNIRERIWMHFEDGRCGVFGENLPDNRVCVTVCVKRIEET